MKDGDSSAAVVVDLLIFAEASHLQCDILPPCRSGVEAFHRARDSLRRARKLKQSNEIDKKMKKTLITLLAMASCAMGMGFSDLTEFTVAETVDVGSFDFTSNAVTVAVTLNVDAVKGYFQGTDSHLLINVTGNNAMGVGTLVKNNKEYLSGAWNQTVDYEMVGSSLDMGNEAVWSGVEYASLVFSADRTTGARAVLTLGDAHGCILFQTVGTASGVKASGWVPSGLTLDTTAVTSVGMTNSYVTVEQAKSIGLTCSPSRPRLR